jgi:hypothetical protein
MAYDTINILMRTQEEITKIKSRFSKPYSVENFLTDYQVQYLVNLFSSLKVEKNKVYKNTGPTTLDIVPFLDDPVIKLILDKLTDEIGTFELNAGFFFWTNYPHIIHNDDTYEYNDVYKGITIPLELEGNCTELPSLCFFDQHYFGGPAKFFNEDADIPTYYNKQIYEYIEVENLTVDPVDKGTYLKFFTHLKPKWLKGLSLQSVLEWKPTSALIFDSVQLHCASDFRQQRIRSKLGISIFTRKV